MPGRGVAEHDFRLLLRRDRARPARVLHQDQRGARDPPALVADHFGTVRLRERLAGAVAVAGPQSLPGDAVVPVAAADLAADGGGEELRLGEPALKEGERRG